MNKSLIILGSALVGAALVIYTYRNRLDAVSDKTRSVTSTATQGAQGAKSAVVTTPIKSPAFVQPASALDLLLKAGGQILSRTASLILPAQTNRMTRQGNAASAAAAYKAPLRAEYKPSAYADPISA